MGLFDEPRSKNGWPNVGAWAGIVNRGGLEATGYWVYKTGGILGVETSARVCPQERGIMGPGGNTTRI